jgi:hypothetical protein
MMVNPGGGPDPPHFVIAVTTKTSAVPLQHEISASASAMSPPSPVVPKVGTEPPDTAIVT